jgi:hypothetical protein
MASISLIVLKHFKQEVGRSTIDLCLDKETPGLLAVLPVDIEKNFYQKFGEKNTFRAESDQTDLLILDIIKYLRINSWNILTSNSFVHLSLEKTVESHFYFEKLIFRESDNDSIRAFNSYLQSQVSEYEKLKMGMTRQDSADGFESKGKSRIEKPSPTPEVMAMILEKSSTPSGPYSFAKKTAGKFLMQFLLKFAFLFCF